MTLRFPKKAERRLSKTPLEEVVCQVRVPPILRIVSEQPAKFQDLIRKSYPEITVEQNILLRLQDNISLSPSSDPSQKIFRFLNPDNSSAVSLSADFFALSSKKYLHWDDFRSSLDLIANAFRTVYEPNYYTRIGLRYVNKFTLENTKFSNAKELMSILNPELTSCSRSSVWDYPIESHLRLLVEDEQDGKLNLRVAQITDETNSPILLLDFDYFVTGQLVTDDLLQRCNIYHDVIYNAFRWCVVESMLDLFEPIN